MKSQEFAPKNLKLFAEDITNSGICTMTKPKISRIFRENWMNLSKTVIQMYITT